MSFVNIYKEFDRAITAPRCTYKPCSNICPAVTFIHDIACIGDVPLIHMYMAVYIVMISSISMLTAAISPDYMFWYIILYVVKGNHIPIGYSCPSSKSVCTPFLANWALPALIRGWCVKFIRGEIVPVHARWHTFGSVHWCLNYMRYNDACHWFCFKSSHEVVKSNQTSILWMHNLSPCIWDLTLIIIIPYFLLYFLNHRINQCWALHSLIALPSACTLMVPSLLSLYINNFV